MPTALLKGLTECPREAAFICGAIGSSETRLKALDRTSARDHLHNLGGTIQARLDMEADAQDLGSIVGRRARC